MAAITDLATVAAMASADFFVVNQSGTDRKVPFAAAGAAAIVRSATVSPSIQGGTSAGTYSISNNVSRYIKIGTLVVINYGFNVTVSAAGSGYIKIDLPFATVANSVAVGQCDIDGADYSAGYTYLVAKPDATSSTSYCYIAQCGDNVSTIALPIGALTSGDKINLTLMYEASS